jgi:hypothetical protein
VSLRIRAITAKPYWKCNAAGHVTVRPGMCVLLKHRRHLGEGETIVRTRFARRRRVWECNIEMCPEKKGGFENADCIQALQNRVDLKCIMYFMQCSSHHVTFPALRRCGSRFCLLLHVKERPNLVDSSERDRLSYWGPPD